MNRPQHTERVIDAVVAQWFVRCVTRLIAAYAVVVGVAILIGGPQRFAGLSYRVAIQTPGAPSSWGVAIILAGVLMLAGSLFAMPRIIALGALLGAIWAALFAWAFSVAAIRYDEANTTAQWAYLTLFVLCGLISGVHIAMHPLRRRNRKV